MASDQAREKARQKFEKLYFEEEFLTAWRAELRDVLNLDDEAKLPKLFSMPLALPAEIGTAKRLRKRRKIKGNQRKGKLYKVLKAYFTSDQYAWAMLAIKKRHTLDMRKGTDVTDADRAYYADLLNKRQRAKATASSEDAAALSSDSKSQ